MINGVILSRTANNVRAHSGPPSNAPVSHKHEVESTWTCALRLLQFNATHFWKMPTPLAGGSRQWEKSTDANISHGKVGFALTRRFECWDNLFYLV
ncbi:hypothetical protein BDQ17DRAFT_879652 [Cyathus striatus]|nr:hypothetical protein BDQ17DRAFT_879652 [Cyathus striatus]